MKQGVFEIGVCRQTLVARFKIQGNLRFLSHAETTRLVRRALVRSGVELYYSEGFNPQPRLSLPLPHSVAVASDDELFCASILCANNEDGGVCEKLKLAINNQFPVDCRLSSVEIFNGKISPKAVSARYYFPIKPAQMNKAFQDNIEYLSQNIIAAKPLIVERTIDKKGQIRQIDVCHFLESITLDEGGITAKCMISNAGTIRPAEIMKLLTLDYSALNGPIRRSSVKWKMN